MGILFDRIFKTVFIYLFYKLKKYITKQDEKFSNNNTETGKIYDLFVVIVVHHIKSDSKEIQKS